MPVDGQSRALPTRLSSAVASIVKPRCGQAAADGDAALHDSRTGVPTGQYSAITAAADPWLDTLTSPRLQARHPFAAGDYTSGSLPQRTIYHYWYHTGENMAICRSSWATSTTRRRTGRSDGTPPGDVDRRGTGGLHPDIRMEIPIAASPEDV